jgi:AcrR family transcriptional regulator
VGTYEEKNRKTKRLIQASFLNLLARKPFEAITVGDIAKEAHLNRGTFYLHYMDKFDLLEQMEQQLFEDLGKQIDELRARYSATPMFGPGQAELAAALFRSIQKHVPVLKVLLGDHGRSGFHYRLRDALAAKVRANLLGQEHGRGNAEVPPEYLASFITSAFLGLIEQWVRDDLDKTPEEMAALYMAIIAFIRNEP